jgi:type IV secretory pathway component VirB8
MSLSNIHFDLKEILEEAITKKDYKKVMAILNKLTSSFNPQIQTDGILFKDVKEIVKNKEDLENILLSTKVVCENKDELLEFFEMLLEYGYKENAISYFEEIIHQLNDIEIINGFNSLLRK